MYEATDGFNLNGFRGDYALGVSFPVSGFSRVVQFCDYGVNMSIRFLVFGCLSNAVVASSC